jgi:hypothetical protein
MNSNRGVSADNDDCVNALDERDRLINSFQRPALARRS